MKHLTFVLPMLALLAAGPATVLFGCDRTHEIAYGDTLWDLSIRYYGTPFHWEEILAANPSLRGVECLTPGDVIVIPDLEAEAGVSRPADPEQDLILFSDLDSTPQISRMVLETAGFISQVPPSPLGYVVEIDVEDDDPFHDVNSYTGDLLALDIGENDGVREGRLYRLMEAGEEVRHPETGEKMGRVYRVAGICRVMSVDEGSCVVLLEHSYLPVNVGDMVLPYSAADPVPVVTSETVNGLDACVVAFKDPCMKRAYSYDVVYIDRGSEDGLEVGDIFSMYEETRAEDRSDESSAADVKVADMIVLDTRDKTSAVLIFSVSTPDLVAVGDKVELVREQI